MLISLYRIFKFAVQNLYRNWWLTAVTTLVLILTLTSINGLLILNLMMQSTIKAVENQVDVSIYFKPNVSESRAREVRTILNRISGITSIRLVKPEEALAAFEARYERDSAIAEALKVLEQNPFGSTLVIKAEAPDVYKSVLETIAKKDFRDLIADHTFDDHVLLVEKVGKFSRRLNQFGITVSAIFGIIALLIAITTVRVALYTHREAIGIMKLVGASNWFVRLPYLIGGAILSMISVGIAFLILFASLPFIEANTAHFVGNGALDLTQHFYRNFWELLGTESGGAVIINLLVMNFAVGRYLKV